ncbi:MAG: peptidoglycan-binding protein LysM [Myxococcota bacterium]
MGLIDFVQDVGRKIGMFGGRKAAEADQAREAAVAAAAAAKEASDAAAKKSLELSAVAADIEAAILSYIPIAGLDVKFDGRKATVSGTAFAQADKEKAVLVAGNTEGVAQVDDQIRVETPAPPATYHTVVKGDTLSLLSKKYYGGVIRLYDAIFDANKPMLNDPDEIYPGQLLRIPPVQTPVHTVAKGETLGTIAKHWYGEADKYQQIATANGLADANKIEVGQQLKIPLIDPRVAPLA